jgi:hypothetical protein
MKPMTAEQILAEMTRVYAACRSYRDFGVVRRRFGGLPGIPESEDDRPFRTAFVRPDRFRFEFSSTHANTSGRTRYIVHASGETIQTGWDVSPGIERSEGLSSALAGATGVSGGSAHTVPAMLLPDLVRGRRLTDLEEVSLLDDGDHDGAACYRVQGRPSAPSGPRGEASRRLFRDMTGLEPPTKFEPVLLWIDRRTLLLRRVEHEMRLSLQGEASIEVRTYEPAVDIPIADEELAFNPPGGMTAAEPVPPPERAGDK